jgi:hypothetical protein
VTDGLGLDLLGDVAYLNGLLVSGVSLSLVAEPGLVDGAAIEFDWTAVPTGQGASARVVLVATDRQGGRREASRRLRLTPGRRPWLLALSAGLAECAMDLGLGTSVCRGAASKRLERGLPSCENA